MKQYTQQLHLAQETISLSSALGSHAITPKGYILGKVTDIRVNEKTLGFDGVIIKKGLSNKIYVSKDYISKISKDSVILTAELLELLVGRKVISHEGEELGKVKSITRVKNSNEYESIEVSPKSIFKKSYLIRPAQVKSIGESIILHEPK